MRPFLATLVRVNPHDASQKQLYHLEVLLRCYNQTIVSEQTLALICLFIASFLWATVGTVAKFILKDIDPLTAVTLRMIIAALVLTPVLIARRKQAISMFLHVLPVSLFSAINVYLFLVGINKTTSNASAVVYTATPLLVLIIGYFFIKEQPTIKKVAGIVVGLLGVLVILLVPLIQHHDLALGTFSGNAILFLAVCSWALYTVSVRRLVSEKKYSPIMITAITFFISSVLFILLSFLIPHTTQTPITHISIHLWILLIYYGVFTTVFTYLLHQWVIKHSSASTGALTHYIQPIFAVVINWYFLKEIVTPTFFLGGTLVIGGVFLASGSQAKAYIHRLRKKRENK